MIYLFYGSDVEKARTKAFGWVAAARKKQPDLAYIRLAREDLSPRTLEEVTESGGLFIKRILVLIDDPFPASRKNDEDEDETEEGSASLIEDWASRLAASDNAIVILAPKLLAAKAKKLVAKADKAYEFKKTITKEARGFNSGLVNALAMKNGEKLWLEIVRATELGDAPEQIHGLLHWKARDLLAKGGRAWSETDARALSLSLIKLVMDTRRKGLDFGRELERFALSM